MNIVVNTNIVFSAIWNTNGRIANILSRRTSYNLYSPTFLLLELKKHRSKLANKLQLNEEEFLELQRIITRKIMFIEEAQISKENWIKAERLTYNIDLNNVAFVSLALELDCPLWTGDKKLIDNLKDIKVVTTEYLFN